MKALTLWQPWASLVIVHQAKPWEFRGRSYFAYIDPPKPGERIAVHAASRPTRLSEVEGLLARILGNDAPDLIPDRARAILEPLRSALKNRAMKDRARALAPLGCVLGTAVIGQPKQAHEIFGVAPGQTPEDYNWAWPLTDIEPFTVPVPANGRQGFWEWRA